MTSTPRLDSLAAGGTNGVYDGIRLADGHMLTLVIHPGADRAESVFLYPGLTAPDTEAWENEDWLEDWLTGGSGETTYGDVPVEAVRELIVAHGGEHENQEPPQDDAEKTDEAETAEAAATRALAEWGITAHRDDDAGNTWLVVGYDQTRQGFPDMLAAPYAVLYYYTGPDGEEITVDRAPATGYDWHVLTGDGTGAERTLLERPADQLAACVEAIAEWVTTPQASPDPLTQLAELHGTFELGYSADDVRSVFGRIADEGGPYLVCVWEYADEYGFGGNSEFYAEGEDGTLFEVQPDVHRWLSGKQETPGPLDTWVCAPVTEPTDFPVSDDFHNYARADRSDN
ncbi:hypothetical protein ACP4I1_32455 [Streptomyces sp. WG4]|uniref:hypothetical protein n=1 Tax=Streptomyces sp. WG4 TaxID=3417649 RepID=UPI003CEF5D80